MGISFIETSAKNSLNVESAFLSLTEDLIETRKSLNQNNNEDKNISSTSIQLPNKSKLSNKQSCC